MATRVRWVSLALAAALALPLPVGIFVHFHLWLSPNLFLQAVLSGAPLAPFQAGAVAVALLAFRGERWFCRHLCPVGALNDLAAAGRKRRPSWDRVPFLNRAAALAGVAAAVAGVPLLAWTDPVALFTGAWGVFRPGTAGTALLAAAGLGLVVGSNLLFPRLWCARLCPLGGFQVLLGDVRRALRREAPATGGALLGRRNLLASVSGLAAGLLLRRSLKGGERAAVRPPAALPEGRFKATCCRCGSCARVCPTRILRPSDDLSDPAGLLAPRLDFSGAYCLPGCDACGRVCPTGAIRRFEATEKSRIVLGRAEIRLEECLVTIGTECDRCVGACPYGAIRMAGGTFDVHPEVAPERCVGCGACQAVCPPGVVSIRPV